MKIIWFVKIISLRFQPSPLLAIFVESSDVVYVWKQMCRPKKTCRPNPRPKVSCVIMYFRIWIRFIHPPPCVPTVSSLSISILFSFTVMYFYILRFSWRPKLKVVISIPSASQRLDFLLANVPRAFIISSEQAVLSVHTSTIRISSFTVVTRWSLQMPQSKRNPARRSLVVVVLAANLPWKRSLRRIQIPKAH